MTNTNLMACCLGGTSILGRLDQCLPPGGDNTSCGQAKGGAVDTRFVDPRTLPALPTLVRVRYSGEIEADPGACAKTEIPAEHMV